MSTGAPASPVPPATQPARDVSVLERLSPPWLKGYQRSWLSRDVIAGVTLAAVAIPETMGYTSIAQTPVVTGLYTVIFPTLVFALLGSSRLLVVGADSATAAILAAGLAGLGIAGLSPNSAEWLAWTSLVALVCGGLLVLARLLKLGFLGDFLSTSVLVGFLTGVGIQVFDRPDPRHARDPQGLGQLVRAAVVRRSPTSATPTRWTVAFAAGALAIILGFKRFVPAVPGAVVAVILSIILSATLDASAHGVAVVGAVTGRVPAHRAAGGDHLERRPQGAGHRVLLLRPDHRPERRDLAQLRDEARPARRRQP